MMKMTECQAYNCNDKARADLVLFHKAHRFEVRIPLCEKHDRLTFRDKEFEMMKEPQTA